MFKLNLLTPEKKVVVDLEISEITVPTHSGEVNVMPGHVPMISNLGTGVLRYKVKSTGVQFKSVISSGYCEISPEGVNVLTEFVQLKEEMSEEKMKTAGQQAEQKLAKESLTDDEFEATLREAQKARAGLQVLN